MNSKLRKTKKQVVTTDFAENVLSQEEIRKNIQVIEQELKSSTWRDLETNGKFAKNDKIYFISDEMLIAGCDIGSKSHYIRGQNQKFQPSPSLDEDIFSGVSRCFWKT